MRGPARSLLRLRPPPLPDACLRTLSDTNYALGKWDLGMTSPAETPCGRGFHHYVSTVEQRFAPASFNAVADATVAANRLATTTRAPITSPTRRAPSAGATRRAKCSLVRSAAASIFTMTLRTPTGSRCCGRCWTTAPTPPTSTRTRRCATLAGTPAAKFPRPSSSTCKPPALPEQTSGCGCNLGAAQTVDVRTGRIRRRTRPWTRPDASWRTRHARMSGRSTATSSVR